MAAIINDRDKLLSVSTPRSILDTTTINVIVLNPLTLIPADGSGNPTSYANTGNTISVTKSGVPMTYGTGPNNYAVTSYVTSPLATVTTGAVTTTNNKYNIASLTYMDSNTDVAIITYTITVKDTDGTPYLFYATQTVNKIKEASLGLSARAVSLSTTTQAFAYNSNSVISSDNPVNVFITAVTQNTVGTVWYEFLIGSSSTLISNTTNNRITYTPPTLYTGLPQTVTVRIREDSPTSAVLATDVLTLFGVRPGADAISGYLSNESATVPASADGTVSSFSTAGGTFTIYDGITNVTGTEVIYSVVGTTNMTLTLYNYGGYDINTLTADIGTATLRAVYKGVAIQKIYSISKSKAGAPGAPGATGTAARTVDLVSQQQAFLYNAAGTSPTTPSVVVTATARNTTGTPWYEFIVRNTSRQNTTSNIYTYTPTPLFESMPEQIVVKVRENSSSGNEVATDVMSMIAIKPGADGAAAVSVFLTNEATTVPADSAGLVANFDNAYGIFNLYEGITDKTGSTDIVYSIGTSVGVEMAISSTGQYRVISMSADTGSATIRALYKTLNYEKTFSITKSKAGPTGAAGAGSRTVNLTMPAAAFVYTNRGITPTPANSIITATALNTVGTPYYEFLVGSTSVQNSTTNTYTYTPASDHASMPQLITVKVRETNTTSAVLASDIMSMIGIKLGTDPVSGFLSNETTAVPSDSSGVVSSLANTGGTFYLYDGITNKTTTNTVTYSVVSATGVSISITSAGVYTITAVTTDYATAILRAVYNGVTIDKSYSISKSKAGVGGNPGQRSITISAFAWALSKPANSGAVTYTWATGAVSAYPAGWQGFAGASTANGQILYQINLVVTDTTGVSATTSLDWSTAVSNTIGYRQDGTIGPQGASVRVAYIVTTSSSPPGAPAPTSGTAPSGWSFTATSSLSPGYFMYKSDGILESNGFITWGVPYLSNLKVGSLQAISGDMGTLTSGEIIVGSAPVISGTSMTGSGTHLYSDGKFTMGNASTNINYNGITLTLNGDVVLPANILAGSLSLTVQYTIYGSIDWDLPHGTEINHLNANIISSFTVNNSNSNPGTFVFTGTGRTGYSGSGPNSSQTFGVFDGLNRLYYYGWSPAGEDAKSFSFIYDIPGNTAKTFDVRGAKSLISDTITYGMTVTISGIRN